MVNDEIQNYPVSNSPNHDAFEGIVELYFDLMGYITSSGKWFWKKEDGNQQRGYQDIDVLAINGEETIIVSVSSNFDDKLNFSKGEINEEKSKKLLDSFKRVYDFLANTEKYKWLVSSDRKVLQVIALINSPKDLTKYNKFLDDHNIKILIIQDIIKEIFKYLEDNSDKGLKIQNQTLRLIQILKDKDYFK
jgi:hypothetical protein